MMTGMSEYPRDLTGYAGEPPHAHWPDGARIAVQFVLNIEEGGENCVLHGDAASEAFLSEIIGAQPIVGGRNMSMESIYEYGSRTGAWRILDVFREHELPLTIFAVAMAAERTPQIIERALADGHEIASHGLRWINYHEVPEEVERAHMAEAMDIGEKVYNANCAACHMPNGEGLPGVFPALKGSQIAVADQPKHIDILVNGVTGTAMQAYAKQLTMSEIAAVVTYERNAWGNNTGDLVQAKDINSAMNGQ